MGQETLGETLTAAGMPLAEGQATNGPPGIVTETPALLGPPELSAFRAYSTVVPQEVASDETAVCLGQQIYAGRQAGARLQEEGATLSGHEAALLRQRAVDGQKARIQMASLHLQLVLDLSSVYANRGRRGYDEEVRTELTAVGNLALLECMNSYTPLPGVHFARYAKSCIRTAMVATLWRRTADSLGHTTHTLQTFYKLNKEYEQLQAQGAVESQTFAEFAKSRGHSNDMVWMMRGLHGRIISLDAPDKYLQSVYDRLAYLDLEGAYVAVENTVLFGQALDIVKLLYRQGKLNRQELAAFVCRYVDGMTQQETAEKMGLKAQSRVSELEGSVLHKIRRIMDPTATQAPPPVAVESLPVESATDLIERLEIPNAAPGSVTTIANNILDFFDLTFWQREVMRSLLGLNGKQYRSRELARISDRPYSSVSSAKAQAIAKICSQWAVLSAAERQRVIEGGLR